jgi:hypothetical protein
MTEEEWLATTEPDAMFPVLPRTKGVRRKRQLFCCACCRLIWNELPSDSWRRAVEITERFIDGIVSEVEREAATRAAVIEAGCPINAQAASRTCRTDGSPVHARFIAHYTGVVNDACIPLIADLLRDIFGDPFCPVSLRSAWLTSDVLALARGIYDERAFDRMPILADALQDAGCDNDDILNHCRDASLTHVRGCWVVDLVLGKQ